MKSRQREYKTVPSHLGRIDEAQGIVEHLISLYGILDLGGDVTHPGSFAKTIDERMDSIRVLDSHNRYSALGAVGVPLKLWEVDATGLPEAVLKRFPEATGGAMAETQFLLGTPEGAGIFERIRAGAVKEFSFAYDALDYDHEKIQVKGRNVRVRNLRTVRLWEYGPVVFGMNPGALVTSAKDLEDLRDTDSEEKPAPDVSENTIRIRVKDPGAFKEGSFRTISIGKESQGIQAVVGHLEGETSMTVQSYIFDKDKWTVVAARKWADEHKPKSLNEISQVDSVLAAFQEVKGEGLLVVRELSEDHLIVEDLSEPSTYYRVEVVSGEGDLKLASHDEWVAGDLVFVERESVRKARNTGLLMQIQIEQGLSEIARLTSVS